LLFFFVILDKVVNDTLFGSNRGNIFLGTFILSSLLEQLKQKSLPEILMLRAEHCRAADAQSCFTMIDKFGEQRKATNKGYWFISPEGSFQNLSMITS
jgi:hypothetical protein